MQLVHEETDSEMPSYSRLECAEATGPGGQQSGAGVGGLQDMEAVADCSVQSPPTVEERALTCCSALPALESCLKCKDCCPSWPLAKCTGCSLHPA